MTRVLVFCPVHPEKGLHPLTRAALDGLTYAARDVWTAYGNNPYAGFSAITDGRMNILHNYEAARTVFLAGPWDYLLTVESDMEPPANVIEQLLEADADLAYSLYVFRRSKRWSAYTKLVPGWGQSLSQDPAQAAALFGQTIPVAGMGLGATLIRRAALEAVPFRGFHGMACDGWLALDAQTAGLTQKCVTACVSGHVDGAEVLYPTLDTPELYTVIYL